MTKDEAIKELRGFIGHLTEGCQEAIKVFFPELKESEDEKIRKELIAFLKENHETGRAEETWSLSGIERWIAWLEKQKDSVSNTKYIEDVAHAFEDGRKKGIDEKQEEQKSAEWSEEDEEKRDDIVKIIEYSTTIPAYGKTGILKLSKEYKKELTDWLKSLHPQPKQEQKPEVKHIGWVARDSEHDSYLGLGLILFKGKPIRSGNCWTGIIDSQLPWESFPDLKWEDEPLEVEIEVTIRKK